MFNDIQGVPKEACKGVVDLLSQPTATDELKQQPKLKVSQKLAEAKTRQIGGLTPLWRML